MTDNVTQDKSETGTTSWFSAVLIIITLIGPHTLQITSVNQIDYSYLQYTAFSVFWTISYETGSTLAGPYSQTLFEFLSNPALILSILFLPLYLAVIIAQMRFVEGTISRKSTLRIIGLTLIVQAFILFAFFWYALDGWAFAQSYPLPIVHTLAVLAVVQRPP